MEPVCSLHGGEQTGFNKIHKMAINQLGHHTGKKGQATWVRLNVPFIFPVTETIVSSPYKSLYFKGHATRPMVIRYFELAPVTGQVRAKRMRVRCARKEKSDEKIGASGLLDSAADLLFTDSYSSIMLTCYDESLRR